MKGLLTVDYFTVLTHRFTIRRARIKNSILTMVVIARMLFHAADNRVGLSAEQCEFLARGNYERRNRLSLSFFLSLSLCLRICQSRLQKLQI